MRVSKAGWATVGLLGLLGGPKPVQAQAVAFAPQVSSLPDGVGLSATPIVSSDRRYVRLSLGVGFQTINGFSNFPIPAAVSNGGGAGGAGRGVGGLGGLGGLTGMNGPIGPGMAGGMSPFVTGGSDYGDDSMQDLGTWRPAPTRPKAARNRSVRSKKPVAEPLIARAKVKP